MIAGLPVNIAEALQFEISGFPPAEIRQAAERLSLAYRGNAQITATLTALERAAYLAVRFPSTFAAANLVWEETARLIPLGDINTVLDAGSGPGTASLAARSCVPSATRFTRFERDAGWRDAGDRLAAACGLEGKFQQGAISRDLNVQPHDVVVAGYALGELPAAEREVCIAGLWSRAERALIVIEPGTPKGFESIRQTRQYCLSAGGHAAAPCTHDATCPMSGTDWCHRPVRVMRSATHRAAKRAELGYEDEKFAYIVMTREAPARLAPARIVRKPIRNAGHLHLDVCGADGLKRRTVARSDGALYRLARDASWGDLWPPQED